jgi:hypothetical protein
MGLGYNGLFSSGSSHDSYGNGLVDEIHFIFKVSVRLS